MISYGQLFSGNVLGDDGSDGAVSDQLFQSLVDSLVQLSVVLAHGSCVVLDSVSGVQVVIVTEDSAIASVDDLFADGASHAIGVQRNTTGDLYSTWDLEDAGLATIDRYSKGADAVQALLTGKVDCVVIDNEPAKAFVAANEGLKILDTAYAVEDYAAAMNKDNTELYEAVNKALEELIADGTVKSIVEKYIPAE